MYKGARATSFLGSLSTASQRQTTRRQWREILGTWSKWEARENSQILGRSECWPSIIETRSERLTSDATSNFCRNSRFQILHCRLTAYLKFKMDGTNTRGKFIFKSYSSEYEGSLCIATTVACKWILHTGILMLLKIFLKSYSCAGFNIFFDFPFFWAEKSPLSWSTSVSCSTTVRY